MKLTMWLAAIGVAGTAFANTAKAADNFIRPENRIKGCIAIVDKVRDGTISPTDWLEQNKEEFADLQLELKSRNYPPQKSKDMMMGMAITLCMERKVPDYINTCANARDPEKRDIQIMRTAHIGECWARQVAQAPHEEEVVVIRPPTPPPPPPPPPAPRQPNFSSADLAMLNEDLAIVTQPVTIIGDHENGAKENRLNHCGGYWNERIHHNRSQEVRNILWAVRVWRCMFRTNYTIFTQRCPGVTLVASQGWGPALHELQRPHCYARYG